MTLLAKGRVPLLALLAGGVAPLGFAPVEWVPLLLLSLLGVLLLLRPELSPRGAALLGWCYGVGYFGVGVSWVSVAVHDMGQSPWPVAALVTGLLVAYLALYWGLAFGSWVWLRQRIGWAGSWGGALLLLVPIWAVADGLRGVVLGGFPWLAPAYAATDTPLAGWAPIFGSYGVGGLFLLSAVALLQLIRGESRRERWWMGAILLLVWGGGALLQRIEWSQPIGSPITVALIQGDPGRQNQNRWQRTTLSERIQRYLDLTEPHLGKAQLIIWPENAIPAFYSDLDSTLFTPLAEQAAAVGSTLITGGLRRTADRSGYHTSITVVGTPEQRYHKRHLVPFGEFLPFQEGLRGLINFFNIPMSNFTAGEADQGVITAAGLALAPNICYEDLFAEELRPNAAAAVLLLNLSNNGWYGHSFAPHQHLQIARMRSIEFARPTLRATTSGISAFIDEKGGIIQRSGPLFETATLHTTIQPRTGLTPYLRWGDTPALVVMLLSIIGLVVRDRLGFKPK